MLPRGSVLGSCARGWGGSGAALLPVPSGCSPSGLLGRLCCQSVVQPGAGEVGILGARDLRLPRGCFRLRTGKLQPLLGCVAHLHSLSSLHGAATEDQGLIPARPRLEPRALARLS